MVITKFAPPNYKANKRGPPIWKFNSKSVKDSAFMRSTDILIDEFCETESQFPNILEFWETLKGRLKLHSIHYGIQKKKNDRAVLRAAEVELNNSSIFCYYISYHSSYKFIVM